MPLPSPVDLGYSILSGPTAPISATKVIPREEAGDPMLARPVCRLWRDQERRAQQGRRVGGALFFLVLEAVGAVDGVGGRILDVRSPSQLLL